MSLLIFVLSANLLYASNYKWDQKDWSGGGDTSAIASHPDDQINWIKFFNKDLYLNTTTPGEISLLPKPALWTQTSDIMDFDTGTLTNLRLVGSGTYVTTRHEETDSAVSTTGTWNIDYSFTPSGGQYKYSNAKGSTARFTFTGSGVAWIGPKYSTFGIAKVYIDGILQASVDLYSSTAKSQQVLWSISGLSNTTSHTITIEVTGTKNASAYNTVIGVDAFDVIVPQPDPGAYLTFLDVGKFSWTQTSDIMDFDTGTLTNLRLVGSGTYVTTRHEETDSAVATTGTWNIDYSFTPSGGQYKYSNAKGSTASFTFSGSGVAWIGPKYSTFGIAKVYIDGILQASVDLYSSTAKSQQVLWSTSSLTNGTHTITIEVTGTKNASAYNTVVGVDAFDVIVPQPDIGAYLMLSDNTTSGVYESRSLDVGTGGANYFSIAWNATVPAGSGLRFQIAANNDNTTWNFKGPDGTSATFYETSGTATYSGHNGNRYIKYKAFFNRQTFNAADSPILNDVTINYGVIYYLQGMYESRSFDVGPGGAIYSSIAWNATVPAGSGLRFQIAANNDNTTWNFKGPDGTSATFYETSGTATYSGHNGNRYIKYKAFFNRQTFNTVDSPILNDVTINYGVNPYSQSLISSPYDTTDNSNVINRLRWSESLPPGTDIVIQIGTSPDGTAWGPWYGPHDTPFSASKGLTDITVANSAGFSAGSKITLTNSADASQMEVKKIISINTATNVITLDSALLYAYLSNSILTDTYTDAKGTEPINPKHRSGYFGTNDDRWLHYKVFLFTDGGAVTPVFLENIIDYFTASAVYQPDGVIDGNGDNIYGGGSGGLSIKDTDPYFKLHQPLTYNILVQNDGTSASIDDTYTISWNTPSDVSGTWTVYLNDGTTNLTSPVSTVLNVQEQKAYLLKVSPSNYAPGDSAQDVIMTIRSENDYSKIDTIKATTRIRRVYQGDALIDGSGDNIYDITLTGGGGLASKGADSFSTVNFSIGLQNEGNISDTYTFSLGTAPPVGWTVLLNDGSTDHDITNSLSGWTTPSTPSLPSSSSTVAYSLKVILPKGPPTTADIILNIFSNGGGKNVDSITARVTLNTIYKVDGVIYGYGYDAGGIIKNYGVMGAGCGTAGPGDNIYGSLGSGIGGCTAIDIVAGSNREITVGLQNEGNIPDTYGISWSIPAGWSIVMQERLNNGSIVEYTTPPVNVPTGTEGNPAAYNYGEVPFFTFKITPPSSFVAGSSAQPIIFNIMSLGDNTKVDSVKAVVNSSDTTPPSAVLLTPGSITTRSIKISWTAPGDDGTSGTASSYDIRISSAPFTTDAVFNNAEKVKSCKAGESTPGKPKSSGSSESCTVSSLFADTDYYFALKSMDDAGNTSAISTCTACPAHTLVSGDAIPPGTVTDLSVTGSSKDTITLCWTAKADDGSDISSDTVTVYDLRYSRRNIVEDSVTPGVGEVKFSNAYTLIPSGGFLPPKSSGMKECYIVPVENKINLGGGIIDDRTQNTRFYFAVKALDEARNKSSISNVAGGMTTLTPNAYNMVSVPSHPVVPDDTPVAVFGDDVGAQLYLYGWDSSGANWNNGCYNGWPLPNNVGSNVCTQLTSVKEGRGYFLWTPSASISIDVPASSTVPALQDCTDDTLPVPVHFQCYVMALQDGWNMTGPPFDKEINFSSRDIGGIIERGLYIRKTTSGISEVAKFQTAATSNNWIDGSVYAFNGTNYAFETCSQDGAGESLGTQCSLVFQPWKAYWIRVHGGGGPTFELLVPW